jgi:hypothetical protein
VALEGGPAAHLQEAGAHQHPTPPRPTTADPSELTRTAVELVGQSPRLLTRLAHASTRPRTTSRAPRTTSGRWATPVSSRCCRRVGRCRPRTRCWARSRCARTANRARGSGRLRSGSPSSAVRAAVICGSPVVRAGDGDAPQRCRAGHRHPLGAADQLRLPSAGPTPGVRTPVVGGARRRRRGSRARGPRAPARSPAARAARPRRADGRIEHSPLLWTALTCTVV